MDIQGAELKALRGMVRLLRGRDRVALLIECSPDDLKLAGSSEHELVPLLIDLGFTIHRLDRTPMTRVNSAMDLQDLASNAFSQCDLLASKADNRY